MKNTEIIWEQKQWKSEKTQQESNIKRPTFDKKIFEEIPGMVESCNLQSIQGIPTVGRTMIFRTAQNTEQRHLNKMKQVFEKSVFLTGAEST